ncbi:MULTISPECIES: hypothetical protein [Bradyrhizobium]|uniref:hypothetical protein n=1 Tax=Bradyrhizobium TaxID=374 RepID=UPI001BA829DC|nr:hypothetical protein [Bradyrhizobium liaoningense]MBR0984397.1 hypothetical protein [Bradyrhizobium liaoningense]GMO38392.1 hypothetical protein TM233_55310 [Bradyrhizobium sp. TM233]GMP08002.1 hypothetical protein TM239_50400 [Bradyrhizobium sp. TM239]
MKHCLVIGLALVALCGAATFADARPPTVMNSPGYDARLQESRKALSGAPTTAAPPDAPVVKPKRSKKKPTK